ncbi:MAG: hypothetical protein HYU99_07820 [Deltaproteobacteria bacterium]|nr:hypothetical protein [Deltaproteobacteria bacterium]
MKKILFISKSRLCHNLLQAVAALVPKKVEAVCVESVAEALSLPRRGSAMDLVLVDWNALEEAKSGIREIGQFHDHRRLEGAARVLIHARGASLWENELKEQNFSGFYAKPFLAEELAKIIGDHL